MGLASRLTTAIKAKASKLLERFEDPGETLDYSYERQLELLKKVKRGIADVTTSKKRLELQKAKLEKNVEKLSAQAKESIEAGREDLARLALQRKKEITIQIKNLEEQIKALDMEQEKLIATEKRLSTKIEVFRTKKETIKAQYSAAEAQVKITEATTGISEELTDVSIAIQRAENKTEEMKARAAALDELVETGALEDVLGDKDSIEKELEKIKIDSEVEKELEHLKEESKK